MRVKGWLPVNNSDSIKSITEPFRKAMYNFEPVQVLGCLKQAFAQEAKIQLAYPFETLENVEQLFTKALFSLYQSIPDLERRELIVLAGKSQTDQDWVGVCGYYTGEFAHSWLDIPATGHQVSMRFHEFFRVEEGKVTEMQAVWDIPELMMQANAWPMSPSLGREWHVPGPTTQDGLNINDPNGQRGAQSLEIVSTMLTKLGEFASKGVEAMQLDKYWHPRCNWYGPSGIGTCRGIKGFRNWHQIPFLNAMPNRMVNSVKRNLFAEGDYVAFTDWPGMKMTISGDGFLGIAPSNQSITMRSLDFWRCEGNMIRENWVLIDILDVYSQIGVDVFARLKEFNKAKDIQSI